MTKIALTAAALLIATGGAFAASDHYGSDNANQPVSTVDNSYTSSLNASQHTGQAAKPITDGAPRLGGNS
jgi:hypothetical protein